jgi:hypothetical protein
MPVPSSLVFRVNARTLLIVVLLTVPLLLVDMVLVLDRSRKELTSVSGEHLQTLAESAAANVSRFVEARVQDARLLASHDELRGLARGANLAYKGGSEEQLQEEYEQIDQEWQSPKVASVVARLMGGRTSVSLREYLDLNRSVTRIVVTDRVGASIAATHKPTLYYHGDQAWWIDSFGDGRVGAVHLTDAHWDPVSRTQGIAVSVPIFEKGEERVIGVVRTFVSAGEMGSFVTNAEPGRTGEALVAKRDGTVLGSESAELERPLEAEEMGSIRETLADRSGGYSIVALRGGGQRLVGFGDTGLAGRYADIDWAVLVTQDWEEASGPIESIHFRMLVSGFLAILLVGAIAVFFTTHRPVRFDHLDELSASPKSGREGQGGSSVSPESDAAGGVV